MNGSSALVTGGASGLGRATAERLAEGGAHVVLLDLPASDGEAVAKEIGATFVAGDVTSETDAATAVRTAADLAPLRVTVNCAGIGAAGRTVGREGPYALDGFRKVVEVNLIGTFNVIRLAAEVMAGNEPVRRRPRRHRQHRLHRRVRRADRAVRVLRVQGRHRGHDPAHRPRPGRAQHPRDDDRPGPLRDAVAGGLPQEARDSLGAQVPHPARLGQPAEYAHLVESIVADPMLNGEVIRLDGAIRMAPG